MRLSASERAGILEVLGGPGDPFLCGSRVDDSLAGGDIDLLLVVGSTEERIALLNRKHFHLSELKAQIGDQRIDLTIATRGMIQDDPVLLSVRERAIVLQPE
jgi:hypothetical protein